MLALIAALMTLRRKRRPERKRLKILRFFFDSFSWILILSYN